MLLIQYLNRIMTIEKDIYTFLNTYFPYLLHIYREIYII